MNKKKRIKMIALSVIGVVLIGGLIVGNYYASKYSHIITTYLDHKTTKVVKSKDSKKSKDYQQKFKTEEVRKENATKIGAQIEEEGSVLLKNTGQTLPLDGKAKVSLFSQSSIDFVYGGTGAGSVESKDFSTLKTSFEKSGFKINPTLWDFYETGAGKKYRKTQPDVYGKGAFSVNEVPESVYTDEVKASFSDYNDAGIVVISRAGGESSDLSMKKLESGSHYLELDKDEKDMLKMVKSNFDKVIVLLNTVNPIELDFVDSEEVDAALWIGAGGESGIYSIPLLLNGDVNPSGKLVDTYAYDVLGAPAIKNAGDYTITNSKEVMGTKFMNYSEGIYIGYRYYETRYEDVVLGNETKENFNYDKEVQYPFDYGLSYSDFKFTKFEKTSDKENFIFKVKVTNTGDVAGKEVVPIYMQSPYTDYDKKHGIEKAAVELVGFEKTKVLKPGETEDVSVTVPKEVMKSYDANNKKTYILDSGDYYFTVGKDAHDALNNILSKKGKTVKDGMDYDGNEKLVSTEVVKSLDDSIYASSLSTGVKITNQFETANLNHYEEDVTYLSRKDWEGTYPETYKSGNLEASKEMLDDLKIHTVNKKDASLKMPTMGAKNDQKITAPMLKGIPYDDERWETLLDQLTFEEMEKLVRMGGYATTEMASISLPATVNKDGSAGISGTLVGGKNGAAFPVPVLLSSTWNKKLIEEMGEAVGEDSLALGVAGWYAPGINLHRTPFGGRNFEYFSEDPFLSGTVAVNQIKGAQSKGTFVFMKHYALNDVETNRMGGSIFSNEQAIRELYLKPFEMATREGQAKGVMAGMNRVGTRWTGGHEGLMTKTLRDEWGFKGIAVTDQASFDVFAYEDIYEGLEAGTDLWLNTDAKLWKIPKEKLTPELATQLRNASHNIIYTVVNSNAMNGISAGDKVVKIMPLWKKGLMALNIVLGLLVVGLFTWVIKGIVVAKKTK